MEETKQLMEKSEQSMEEIKQSMEETKQLLEETKQLLEESKKARKKLQKEREYKYVSGLIRYWSDLIKIKIGDVLGLEYVFYYKLSKNKVKYFVRDDFSKGPLKTYTKELTSQQIEQINDIKATISDHFKEIPFENESNPLLVCDEIFKEASRVPFYWLSSQDKKSLAHINKIFARMKDRSDNESYRNILTGGSILWKICLDLGLKIGFPQVEAEKDLP